MLTQDELLQLKTGDLLKLVDLPKPFVTLNNYVVIFDGYDAVKEVVTLKDCAGLVYVTSAVLATLPVDAILVEK